MDDLQSKISQILADPQALQQIQSLGGKLGLNTDNNSPAQQAPPPNPLPEKEKPNFNLPKLMNDETLGTITKVLPLLSKIKQDDDVSRLLDALRPFLSSQRRHKLDEAKKMIQMMKLLPLIKDIGIF